MAANLNQKRHELGLISNNRLHLETLTEMIKIFNRIIAGFLGIIIFWHVSEQAQAIEISENIRVHGFLTQGYFLTSDNRVFGKSDSGGSFDFTEAGLNASWIPSPDFRLAAQGLFRRAGTGHENDFTLDYGLLDYTISSTIDYRFGTRLGRFKIPYGLYNDTRDVIFTRPTILLPQSIYPDRTRNLSVSADGGLVYGEYRDGWGNLLFELGAGIPRGSDLDNELAILGMDFPGNTYTNLSYIGRMTFDLQDGKYRIALTSAWVDTGYNPKFSPPQDLGAGSNIFKPIIFSAQYNAEKLSITAEYAIRPFERTGFGDRFDINLTSESYYLQALYRFNNNMEAILRYDALFNNRNDKHGKKYQAVTGRPAYTQFAKDWTFGLRYHFNSFFLIAAEYHYVDGTAWLPIQDNPDSSRLEQRWHMFSLAAGYRF